MERTVQILIDSRSNYAYGSYYVLGLQNIYGKDAIKYTYSPFKELGDVGNDMRLILKGDNRQIKVFLHLNDSYVLQVDDYAWCDVYGCVNTNYTKYPSETYPKMVSLVPSFGVRFEKRLSAVMWHGLEQLMPILPIVMRRNRWNKYTGRMESKALRNLKNYFGLRYRTWKNREPLSIYANNTPSEDNYIFFLSTLWYNDEWNKNDDGVNLRRAHFIRACKSIEGVEFEGGLLGDKTSSNEKFVDVLAEQEEPFDKWIEKTKRSALVFNTPAFWDCHGWKLGEYLALGKCIVSTKLSNDLPYPLEHGVNIHFVENTEDSMREAIEYLLAHPDYRHKLERGAKVYWEKYGTPEASVKLLGIHE
jgi:Glycosyltransferase